MRLRLRRRQTALLVALVLTSGCAGRFAAPVQLSPPAVVAFQGDRVIRGVQELQTIAINAEASGYLTTDEARAVVDATKISGQAGIELAQALRTGASATSAKERAVGLIRQALTNVPPRLRPDRREQFQPYFDVVLTALTLLD